MRSRPQYLELVNCTTLNHLAASAMDCAEGEDFLGDCYPAFYEHGNWKAGTFWDGMNPVDKPGVDVPCLPLAMGAEPTTVFEHKWTGKGWERADCKNQHSYLFQNRVNTTWEFYKQAFKSLFETK